MSSEEHLTRVRRICLALPGTTEKLSHGEPAFFAGKLYASMSTNHHNDGHYAVLIPAAAGVQEAMVAVEPKKFYRPPYVGVKGWVGIELPEVDEDELGGLITEAWKIVTTKKPRERPR